jgi:hypothetical protein
MRTSETDANPHTSSHSSLACASDRSAPFRRSTRLVLAFFLLCLTAPFADAHGFEGDRFFPPTLVTDDPFAVDELLLPGLNAIKGPAGDGSPSNTEIDAGFEFDKEIFPHFALGLSENYVRQKPHPGPGNYGWDNLTLTAKYEFFHDDAHEAIMSVGLETDFGHTGTGNIADPFTTLTPNFYFGKGFGQLPDSLGGLRPFAVTGQIGNSFPTSAAAPNTFNWGFAVEYSIPYLQQQVQDIGLPAPFKDMIPLVELSLTTPENRGGGPTTGNIDPGVLWITPYFELGAEALIPVNSASGKNVGVTVQLWVFIDDIFPKVFGHPLFGN